MPIGKLAVHYALKSHITVKILVRNSGAGFSLLVPANSNRSATVIENLTNCKQNVLSGLV